MSGFFSNQVVGPLRAPGQIQQWDRDQKNPATLRHWESGNYKPDAKIGLVGGFTAQLESGRALDFGESVPESGGFLTEMAVITFNMGEVNSHPDSFFDQMVAASSVATNFKAYNMKLWVGDLTAFTSVSGLPAPTFFYRTSPTWIRGLSFNPGDANVFVLPSAMPASGNIFNEGTDVFISGAYKDAEFTDFVYLRGQFPSGSFPLGTYGGLGLGTFTFKFSYDYTNIDANVLRSDLEACLET